jgi:hypothetical protein
LQSLTGHQPPSTDAAKPVESVVRDVKEFVHGFGPSNGITLLAVRRTS